MRRRMADHIPLPLDENQKELMKQVRAGGARVLRMLELRSWVPYWASYAVSTLCIWLVNVY